MPTEQMRLPPYADFMGMTAEATAAGWQVRMAYAPRYDGRPGFLHGGAIAGLLEIAAIVAMHEALTDDADIAIKPINVTVDYRRGGRLVDTLASGTVTRLGKRIANVEAVAWQEDRDRPIATARLNILLRHLTT